jgi:LacI family transcriptional regulator
MTKPKSTIRDVAIKAGVAVSSVSRVLNNHPSASESMIRRVQGAVTELDFRPNPAAKSLRTGTSRIIGLVVRDLSNSFYTEMMKGMEEVLHESGYSLLVMNSDIDSDSDLSKLTGLVSIHVDAIFLATSTDKSEEKIKAISKFKGSVVILDREFANSPVGTVLSDHANGVYLATKDLIELGHRNIALIAGTTEIRPTRERCRGFLDALKESSISNESNTPITGIASTSLARAATKKLMNLPEGNRPTAIISGGIDVTMGALECLTEMGLTPGKDISFVACDDLPWLQIMRPRISTVSRDYKNFGSTAANLMISMLTGQKSETILLPTIYESRDTSQPV